MKKSFWTALRCRAAVLIAIAGAITMTVLSASARLGDSPQLNYIHYGAVVNRYEDGPGGPGASRWHASYLTTNYMIAVYYRDNISTCEIFYPLAGKFGLEERETLMNKIGCRGASRMSDYDRFGQRAWTNATTVAIMDNQPNAMPFLTIATREFIKAEGEKVEADAQKKTAGF